MKEARCRNYCAAFSFSTTLCQQMTRSAAACRLHSAACAEPSTSPALLLSLPSLQPGLVATSNKHPYASKEVNAGTEVRWGLLFNRFTSYNPLVQSGITVRVWKKRCHGHQNVKAWYHVKFKPCPAANVSCMLSVSVQQEHLRITFSVFVLALHTKHHLSELGLWRHI